MAEDKLWDFQIQLASGIPTIPLPEKKKEEPKPAASGTAGTEKKFKWATSLDSGFKFDFKGAIPVADLSKVEWAGTKGVERSESGAEGVFFAEAANGAVVIKGSKSMAGEVFASLITMYFGVYVPRCRVLKNEGDEAHLMLDSLKKVDPSWRVVTNLFDLSHVLLKDFVHGVNLDSLSNDRAMEIFGEGGLTENGQARLHEIGALIAVDLLVNNGDRLPISVWGNNGNAGNVMFSPHNGTVMSVDSQIGAINQKKYPQELQNYLKKVDAFLMHLAANDDACISDLSVVKGMIYNFSRYDIGNKGIEEIRQGILKALRQASNGTDFVDKLNQWKDAITAYNPPLVGVDNVDVDFVKSVLEVFKSHAAKLA